jgi:hypothetical protein
MTAPPPDLQALFDDLVERYGGLSAFSPAQLEICVTAIKVMRDLRVASAGETVRLADVLTRLLDRLPPPPPPPPPAPKDLNLVGLGLQGLSRLYSRMIGGEEPGGDLVFDPTAPEPARASAPAPRRPTHPPRRTHRRPLCRRI